MVRFITLWTWTEQGVAKITDTVDRAESFAKTAEKSGVRVTGYYWTVGEYDGFLLHEAPDEATAIAAIARVAKLGNIKTRTMRAFDAGEMRQIVAKVK